MSNDWLCDDNRSYFPVREFYTELEWVKMLKEVQIKEESMTSIYDLFMVVAETDNPKIFIQGKEIHDTILIRVKLLIKLFGLNMNICNFYTFSRIPQT